MVSVMRTLVLALLLPGLAVADTWDPGDDTDSGATALPAPTLVQQVHGPHDLLTGTGSDFVDWFSVPLATGWVYRFETTGGIGDVNLDGFDPAVVFLGGEGLNGVHGQAVYHVAPQAAGTFFVATSPDDQGWIGSLRYAARPLAPDAWDTGDDVSGGASTLPAPTTSVQTHGPHTLSVTDPEDWYAVTLAGGVTYQFDTVGGWGLVLLDLYDAGLSWIASDGLTGGDGQAMITWTATYTGVHYLDASVWTDGWTGSLRYRSIPALPDAWDPGDDVDTGGTVITPTTVTQSHGPHRMFDADCTDWFSVPMTAGAAYHFDTIGGTGDAYMSVTDPLGGFVTDDDDRGGLPQPSVDVFAEQTGTYQVAVYNWGCGGFSGWQGSLNYRRLTVTLTGWSSTGLWHELPDGTGPGSRPFASTSSVTFWYGGDARGTYDTSTATSGTLYSIDYAIPVSATLSFWSWAQTEGDPLDWDTRHVSISVDGGATWTPLLTLADTEESWNEIRIGLAAYAGQTVRFAFAFDSVDDFINNYLGWFVDDVRIDSAAPGVLSASLALVQPFTLVGQSFQARLTVTNTGAGPANGVLPSIQLNTGGSLVAPLTGPVPPGPVALAPGGAQTFVWTYSATGIGAVLLTGSVTGSGGISAAASATETLASIVIVPGALSIAPASAKSGTNVQLVFTVTNTGASAWNNVIVGVSPITGTSLVSAVSGGTPYGPLSVAAGAVGSFTWIYSVTGSGSATFVASLGGTVVSSSAFVIASGSRSVTIVRPAALTAQLTLTPPVVIPGSVVTVVVTITNTGGTTANTINANISTGCCITGPISPPMPAPWLSIPPLSSTRFMWSFTATGMGTSTFTTWITGVDAVFGDALAVDASAPLTSKAALVSASIYVTAVAAPSPVAVGMPVAVVVSVENRGDYAATGVVPSLTVTGLPYVPVSGPVPAAPLDVAPLSTVSFTWTFSVTGGGTASVYVGATGTDSGPGGGAMIASGLGPPFQARYALLTAVLSLPARARRTETVDVRLTVSNSGSGAATGLVPAVSGPGVVVVAGPSPSSAGLAAGGETTFVWTVRLDTAAVVTVAGIAAGADATGGLPVTAGASATILVTAGFDAPLVVYPNPVKGDVLRIGVRARGPALAFTAEIWNIARERVYEGVWPAAAQDLVLEIRGVLGWAPGLYAVRVTANLLDGTTETFPFVRVTVARK